MVSNHNVEYNMSWHFIPKLAANIHVLFFIQTNYVWSSADNKPFISADWNNGLYMNTRRVFFRSDLASRDYYFSSVIDPGTYGSCVVIVYIREYKPLWKMFPCDKSMSIYWLCKSPIKTHNAIQKMVYPSLWCANQYLLIKNTCNQYIFLPSTNNHSINFGVAELDVLYLNRILANHGVEVYFLSSSAVNMTYKQNVQGGLAFPYTNVSFRSTGVKKFQLQKVDTYSLICGPTMQRCDDGSCRIQTTICMSDFKCAPRLCACITDNHLNHDMNYCRHMCPPRICACGPLMFQCSIGGCVPYSHVCDNRNNCADFSDEFCSTDHLHIYIPANINLASRIGSTKSPWGCFDFLCSSSLCIDVQLVNDLIPDCIDADDESHSLSIKYEGVHFRCNCVQQIPCVPGHSKCFAMENICVYDRNDLGHILYCRDGSHLRNCRYIKCTNTFKCPQSYCIPIRKVCDSIRDCLNGEDEINCHNNICSGYLKCTGVEYCIHPIEVCDGYSHCPQGDDEEICDIQGCPTGCICLGRGVVCRDEQFSYIPDFEFQEIIYLSLGLQYTRFPQFANLSSLSKLVILDLSDSMVVNICPALQEDYAFHNSLHLLYLQNNYMNYLSSSCFAKLLSLLVINLHGNPLADIAEDAFMDISLNVLILSNSLLTSLSGQLIRGLKCLKTIDIRGVYLDYRSLSSVDSFSELDTVYSDDASLCCFLKSNNVCHDQAKDNMGCSRLLPHQSMAPILIVLTIGILVYIMLSMWFATTLHTSLRPVQWLLHATVLINQSLCVFYVLAIAIIDAFQGKYHPFWYRSGYNKFYYQALSIVLSSGMIMSNIASSFLDHMAYKAVSRSLLIEKIAKLKIKINVLSLQFLMITGFTLFTILLSDATNHQLSTRPMWGAPLGLPFNDYGWFVIGPLFMSVVIFLSLTYSIFTYIIIFKHTYSSGKRVQAIASLEFDMHKNRLFKLLKNLCRSAIFRFLECLPIISIVLLKVGGTAIGLEIQIMSIITSVTFGCIGSTITSVWYPMFNPIRKSKDGAFCTI